MTTAGIPVFFDLFFARPHDVNCLEALVANLHDCLVFADKGFIDRAYLKVGGLADLGAKTDVGLCKRVIAVLTAFTMGIYINFALGRSSLAVEELFA